jgi:dihydroxy-acid dehydratase
MSSAIEALGMSLPYSSSNPALSEEKKQECLDAGKAIRILLEKDIKPRDHDARPLKTQLLWCLF